MKSFQLEGVVREEFGKKAARELRKENLVPCNLYGVAKDAEGKPVAQAFSVKVDDLRKLIYTPHIYVVDLTIGGKTVNAILKEIQFHPVKDNILHIDFLQIEEDKPIVMDVPVQLQGLAAGVKAGGKLSQLTRKLKVKALYNVIPEKLVIDVTALTAGKSIKVRDLDFEGLEFVTPKEALVCAVKMTRAARSTEEEAEK